MTLEADGVTIRSMTAIAIEHREQIINDLATGARLSDIAPALNVSPNAISKALKEDPEYRSAIEVGFHRRLDRAEEAIEQSIDNVDVSRARARFQSVAWRAEREFPDTWGKIEQSVSVNINIAQISNQAADLLGKLRTINAAPAQPASLIGNSE